jgi:hypothetical protein
MICDICKKKVSSITSYSKKLRICDTCQYIIFNKNMTGSVNSKVTEVRGSISTHDNICIWITSDGNIEYMWDHHRSIHKSFYKGKTVAEIITKIRVNGSVVCSSCGKVQIKFAGSHFAGYYCTECWEQYKKKNSRICGSCRCPMWECVC